MDVDEDADARSDCNKILLRTGVFSLTLQDALMLGMLLLFYKVYYSIEFSILSSTECSFDRLNARWQILVKLIDMGLISVPEIRYTCFFINYLKKFVNNDQDKVERYIFRRLKVADGLSRLSTTL